MQSLLRAGLHRHASSLLSDAQADAEVLEFNLFAAATAGIEVRWPCRSCGPAAMTTSTNQAEPADVT